MKYLKNTEIQILFIREKSITQNFWTNYEVEAIINLDLSVDTEISYEGMKLEEAEQKEINKLIEYLKELGFKEDANE